jgi:hypothetical protein
MAVRQQQNTDDYGPAVWKFGGLSTKQHSATFSEEDLIPQLVAERTSFSTIQN